MCSYIRFTDSESYTRALGKNRALMGTRYIEVFECSEKELKAAQDIANSASIVPTGQEDYAGVVRLRGLPYKASKVCAWGHVAFCYYMRHFSSFNLFLYHSPRQADIQDFFSAKQFRVDANNIHIVVADDGRATGEAFVEFGSEVPSSPAVSSLLPVATSCRRPLPATPCHLPRATY